MNYLLAILAAGLLGMGFVLQQAVAEQAPGVDFLRPRLLLDLLGHRRWLAGAHSPNETDPLLDEMIAHTRRHGLTVMEAGAYALRGRRFFLGGYEDEALTSAAKALAILDEDLTPDTLIGVRSWTRLLSAVLVDIGQLLSQLGVYEIAAGVFNRTPNAW